MMLVWTYTFSSLLGCGDGSELVDDFISRKVFDNNFLTICFVIKSSLYRFTVQIENSYHFTLPSWGQVQSESTWK
jgi:hypothetical protein